MWISRTVYAQLKSDADESQRLAEMYRGAIIALEKALESAKDGNKVCYTPSVVVMSLDTYGELGNRIKAVEEEAKDAKAECEWYRLKYGELLSTMRQS